MSGHRGVAVATGRVRLQRALWSSRMMKAGREEGRAEPRHACRSGSDVRSDCAGPDEIKRREVVLDPQVSPEEIKSREVKLGSESWTFFASVVAQQQCYGHCPCDSGS